MCICVSRDHRFLVCICVSRDHRFLVCICLAGCGEIRLALRDFVSGSELEGAAGASAAERHCWVMKAVCMHSLGQYGAAYAEYSAVIKASGEQERRSDERG